MRIKPKPRFDIQVYAQRLAHQARLEESREEARKIIAASGARDLEEYLAGKIAEMRGRGRGALPAAPKRSENQAVRS